MENPEEAAPTAMLIRFDDPDALPTLGELERQYVLRVLDACEGKIRAARVLGIDRKTLYRKLVSWGETARLSPRRKPYEI